MLTYQRRSFDDIITIKVGPAAKEFKLHEGLLCDASSYFTAALRGKFIESHDRCVVLPEDDANVFEHFQFWIYTGNLLETSEPPIKISWEILIGLYHFGDARDIPALQNAAIDLIIDKEHASNHLSPPWLRQIYQMPKKSPLRRLLADFMAHLAKLDAEPWISENMKASYPREFLLDLTAALYELSSGQRKRIKSFKAIRSEYHVEVTPSSAKGAEAASHPSR